METKLPAQHLAGMKITSNEARSVFSFLISRQKFVSFSYVEQLRRVCDTSDVRHKSVITTGLVSEQ
jgi:hypothetical protein